MGKTVTRILLDRRRGPDTRGSRREARATMTPSDKIAMVTGAGSGIGRATALALLREGYSVVLVGRRADALSRTVADAGTDPSRTLAVAAAVSDVAAVPGVFEKTKDAI